MKLFIITACFLFTTSLNSIANNLIINNVSVTGTTVKFDVSWENSWYVSFAPKNHDAAWIFIKGQDCQSADKAWKHLKLSTSSSDHSAGGLLEVNAVTDGMGVFVKRITDGFGTIASTTITLKFQSTYIAANMNFEVMGIEMVYVPEGAFSVGDGGASSANLGQKLTSIALESTISANVLYNSSVSTTQHPIIPALFPKGFASFYCMKYEITQDQYATFLNLINYTQQLARTAYDPSDAIKTNALSSSQTGIINRNGIQIKTPGSASQPAQYGCNLNNNAVFDEADDGQNIACNFLSWADLQAYLDWSALKPMTELQFEKAARGIDSPVNGEYAWGNTQIIQALSSALTNGAQSGELSTTIPVTGKGLAAYAGATSLGPLRVGFAATQTTDRVGAGASYYGIMELSGNVWEQTVSIGFNNSNASGYTGVLGDGELDSYGLANVANWNAVISTVVRGGCYSCPVANLTVINRQYLNVETYNATRHAQTGGRGVR